MRSSNYSKKGVYHIMRLFMKGNIVKVKPAYCFTKWSRFVKRHPQYALHYAYGHFPDPDKKYEVIGVYKDIAVIRGTEYKVDKKANPIYIAQVDGLEVLA